MNEKRLALGLITLVALALVVWLCVQTWHTIHGDSSDARVQALWTEWYDLDLKAREYDGKWAAEHPPTSRLEELEQLAGAPGNPHTAARIAAIHAFRRETGVPPSEWKRR